MILVKLYLVSALTGKTTLLEEGTIHNDGTGSAERGNYKVALHKSPRFGGNGATVWKRGGVEGFPRLLSAWELLRRGLQSTLGRGRSQMDASPHDAPDTYLEEHGVHALCEALVAAVRGEIPTLTPKGAHGHTSSGSGRR